MAVAAVAHIFVFSVKPYHFLPVSEYRKITSERTQAVLKVQEGDEEKPAILEKKEVDVEAPGTSVKESVQDIVVEGGQKVSIADYLFLFELQMKLSQPIYYDNYDT